MKIGITERGDPVFDDSWVTWCKEGKPAILITKNPSKLLDMCLEEFPDDPPNIILHCSITGWGGTPLEPNVPEFSNAVFAMRSWADRMSYQRLVLRIDPVICTVSGIAKAMEVQKMARELGVDKRVRISFMDMYGHVKKRFEKADIPLPYESFHAPLHERQKAWEMLGFPEICAEPQMQCTGCVSRKDCEILGVQPESQFSGQRAACKCMGIKHELLKKRGQCFHKCLYCYWK